MVEGYGLKIPNLSQNVEMVIDSLVENGLYEGMDFDIDQKSQELTYYNESHLKIIRETVRKCCL